jgi:hypothetical protein
MSSSIYYLTGMGGQLTKGLGEELIQRGLSISGQELIGTFKNLSFQEQIEQVSSDLQQHFWSTDSRVIANSFGAYLFLHAQASMKPYIGKVLLLSPIVGDFDDEDSSRSFSPPRPYVLSEMIDKQVYPTPVNCQIHVGELDWQSNPNNVSKLGLTLNIPVSIIPNAEHMLPKEYIKTVLDKWL